LNSVGYDFIIKNKCCSIYRDGLFYGSSILRNDLYLLDLEKLMYNINNKRLKSSHESMTQMWHHRLGHMNESSIKKLQEVGLLGDLDIESLDTCEFYLVGKMTKAPFTN
jgi:GAG-pre-integrase domain